MKPEEPNPFGDRPMFSHTKITGPALTFRERVALIVLEVMLNRAKGGKEFDVAPLARDVRIATDAVCRAMAEPATEPATTDGIQTERNRCVAILEAAKDAANKDGEYRLEAQLQRCLDAVKSGQPCDEVMG